MWKVLPIALVLASSGCVSAIVADFTEPSPYKTDNNPLFGSQYGSRIKTTADEAFLVVSNGNANTSYETLSDYNRLKSAEEALARGFTHFEFLDQERSYDKVTTIAATAAVPGSEAARMRFVEQRVLFSNGPEGELAASVIDELGPIYRRD